MEKYRIIRIDEADFGCEGLPDGEILKGISKNLLPPICTTSSAVILPENPLTYVSMAA